MDARELGQQIERMVYEIMHSAKERLVQMSVTPDDQLKSTCYVDGRPMNSLDGMEFFLVAFSHLTILPGENYTPQERKYIGEVLSRLFLLVQSMKGG